MKNLINKVRNHGKKVTIYLKSQPKWVVRCMFGIGAILGLVLSIHTHPIGGTNAQSIECPEGQYLATGDVCITNEKDIVIQVTATEDDQTLKINKYFDNDYTVDRGDGTTGNLTEDSIHTYENAGIYNVILSLSGGRWTFTDEHKPLVPKLNTTVTGVVIKYMPSLAEGFGDTMANPGNRFFACFNWEGALTNLPEGSFDTTNITTVGNDFFSYFNRDGALTSLPEGSFDISNITTVGDGFFSEFNYNFHFNGALTSLPEGSFILSTGLTTVGDNFFAGFVGALTNLPDGSFEISNITTVGDDFFSYFGGALTSLPDGSFDISNITTVGNDFFSSFVGGALTSLPEGSFILSTGLTTVGDDFFSHFVGGALTSLPEGSFDLSNITTVGDNFFSEFNYYSGALTSLPDGSFDISNIATVGDNFFSSFVGGSLKSLPEGSFILSTGLTTVGDDFFSHFVGGALTSLPEGSFDLSNITTVGDNFFSEFNYYSGALTSLPDGSFDISNIATVGDNFFSSFVGGSLKSLPEGSFILSTGLTTVGDDFFSFFNGGLVEGSALTSLPVGSFDISNITTVGDHFFSYFNSKGALTSLPTGSFDTSNITSVGNYFFNFFNASCLMISLPDGSFRLSTGLTTVGNSFFGSFNAFGTLTSLPTGSFDTSHITSVGNFFFSSFNSQGALTSLPDGSFDLSNIATVSDRFFSYFNSNGALTHLPDSFKLNSVGSQSVSGYQNAFNSSFTLNKNVSDLVSGVTAPLDDRNVFSDNQPGRCGVDSNWLTSTSSACSITYKTNGGSEILNPKKKYEANTTGVVAGDGIETPTRTGYAFSGWYTAEQGGDLVDIVVFPNMDDGTLYAQWIDTTPPNCDVAYSTTGATTGNVVASLTGCIETITGTETQHTFTGNGTYIFNFQDLAGNTGSTEAAVTWIGEYTGVYEIKSGQQMINLYNQGKAITCNVIYSGDNGHQTNTMYIKSGVINENLMVITGNTRTMLYSLEKDGYIYIWGDTYGSGIGFYIPYELDVYEELKGVDNNIKSGAIITCTTGVEEDSVFDLPDGVDFFNIDTYYIDSGVYFIIDAKETAKTGENIDFMITVMKDGKRFKNFLGYVLIDVIDEDGDLLDKNTYEAPGYGYYYFASSDKGKKTFSNGLKINKTGDYYIRVNSLQEGEGFFPISIKGKNDPTLTGNYFKITVNSKANPGEYTTFTVRAMKDGISYSNYTGTVIFTLSKKDGSLVNKRNYTFSNSGRYTFEASDLGRKIFYSGLKINETGTYILEVNGLNDNFKGSTTINVGKSHGSAEFKYDTLKFNPKYSDEMNEAYQYARYYDITTKDSIKDADMYSGLNRIAMAKMLTNYAENVLGKDNFNTGRNCSFSDVSNSLDKDYDYGVTKACQLGIMGVNMPNNKFYPNGGVTRAEFATALSRLLYGTKDGTEKYYSTHITKLRREGIITNTDPALWELRGYVMLMLKRVAENNDE